MSDHEYWKQAYAGRSLDDYPTIAPADIHFPAFIDVAYAVCATDCGAAEFLVDDRGELRKGSLIPGAPCAQQSAQVFSG